MKGIFATLLFFTISADKSNSYKEKVRGSNSLIISESRKKVIFSISRIFYDDEAKRLKKGLKYFLFLFFCFNRYRRGKLVHRRKCQKVDTLFSSLFFPTRPSDDYDSAPSRKCSRPLLDVFACIG